ncbi:FAD-dependent monooxygenase [Thermoflavimicrobium daqui]|uniref:2-polyprenyl-6-methoxyphenol hydroxylase n=1 Tax=Thermoflavimicrobium daqui TaxID=2137476 RepID=A0A364K7K7_9BACL|nr:FAD-dependent monooxygenase [Thermoflavimicrobium daqui]RAL26279.1 2-polyprenyl-6-methoxyphenol hydroxylase [Thermoflavimicrobium daqui]
MKAIIVGAGIGGLCAAISLKQAGFEVEIFEREPEIKLVGAGLSLWENGTKGLELLGLGDSLKEIAVPNGGKICDWQGKPFSSGNEESIVHMVDVPVMGVHRADLHALLMKEIEEKELHLGSEFICFEQTSDGVTAYFKDGSIVKGSILIGADGVKSRVREQLFPQIKVRYAGYLAWRGVAYLDHSNLKHGENFEAWGFGQRFGILRLSQNRIYWFATINSPQDLRSEINRHPSFLLDRFQGWLSPVEELIQMTKDHDLFCHAIYDMDPMRRWGFGRVTLLGDAAHAMTPNLGQGANQAIEDALVLSKMIQENDQLDQALLQYENKRIQRTSKLILQARQVGRVGQWSHPFVCRVRDLIFRKTPNSVLKKQFSFIKEDFLNSN